LYRPYAEDDRPRPLVVYLHGGGWVIGDLDSHDSLCRQIALGTGYAVLAVHYALAPEHPAPASPDDVLAALHWLAEAGGALHLDLDRVAVAGDSAGGGLAAMAALHLREGPLRLKAQVLIGAGNAVEYHELPGMIHGFIEMLGVLPGVRWTLERMNAFLREQLQQQA
ncbi:alpha/beta hydrolase, partial [Pseudomonas sp. BAV 4579]